MKYELSEHQSKQLINPIIQENVGALGKVLPETVQLWNESAKGKKGRKLLVQLEAIHVGRTKNFTYYTEQGLKDGLSSWTHPYNKPVLTHHDSHHGEPIGRIMKAEFSDHTPSGRKGLLFTCEISDSVAIEKVLDGRYQTVSIGASTDKVTCNICGTDRSQEWCEHWRGETYDEVVCHYTIGTTLGQEVSYVNVPADENAGTIAITTVETEEETTEATDSSLEVFQIAEGLMQNIHMPSVNLYESVDDDTRQLVDQLVNNEKKGRGIMKFSLNESGQIIDGNQAIVAESLDVLHENWQSQVRITQDSQQKLQEAQAALATLAVEKTKMDQQVTESQAEIDRLVSENADLAIQAHEALAEQVVELKIALCKADVVSVAKESAIDTHIKRSKDSLKDALSDLQQEMKSSTVVRGAVKNPGVSTIDKTEEGIEKPVKVTMEDAVDMFKGMFGKKR